MAACTRPGCTGQYAPDGYCDNCGRKAPVTAVRTAPAATKGKKNKRSRAATTPTQPTPTQPATSPISGRTSTGRSSSGTVRSGRTVGRGGLGANLVDIAPIPLRDPATAVKADPSVPESQRFCTSCGEPVGRGRNGQPGLVEGFCPRDRTPFSFKPRLGPGELVDHRYEILGALAHGGLGWIYLARDRNVSDAGADRWVVLKGLINLNDPDAMAAAMAERRFLVEVDHPNIVKIHDFAQHADPKTGDVASYIVMEYVGGTSLKDLALAHTNAAGARTPLPLAQVLAYGLEVLPALGYLHDRGLLFCDFKPDNVIHTEEQLKLIDLGAVIRMGDDQSALYGTPGYQAPEVAKVGPSVSSDIYTVGRTLAVLSFEFKGFSTTYADRLPAPDQVALFGEFESYYRLLQRATHVDPALRFQSVGELAAQLLGVLREVVSAADGQPRPSASTLFSTERSPFGTTAGAPGGDPGELVPAEVAAGLPLPLVDLSDAAAGLIATLGGHDPTATIETLRQAPEQTPEVRLRLVRAHLDAADPEAAAEALLAAATDDWRTEWYTGLIALAGGDIDTARISFDTVFSSLPGEPAVVLALAATDELAGETESAAARYERVWRVDHGYLSAAFGLARVRLAAGDRDAAIAVLDQVPHSSSQHVVAQVASVRARLADDAAPLADTDLADASARLQRLQLDSLRQATLAVEIFRTALHWLPYQPPTASTATVLGQALDEQSIRVGLERAYRTLAALQTNRSERYALVDLANSVRPVTVT